MNNPQQHQEVFEIAENLITVHLLDLGTPSRQKIGRPNFYMKGPKDELFTRQIRHKTYQTNP